MVKDLAVDVPSRLKLVKVLAAAVQRASQRLALMAQDHYEGVQGRSTPATAPPAPQTRTAVPAAAVSFQSLFYGWAAEKRPVTTQNVLARVAHEVVTASLVVGHFEGPSPLRDLGGSDVLIRPAFDFG